MKGNHEAPVSLGKRLASVGFQPKVLGFTSLLTQISLMDLRARNTLGSFDQPSSSGRWKISLIPIFRCYEMKCSEVNWLAWGLMETE